MKKAETHQKVTTKNLHEFLGAPIFVDQEREKKAQVGYVNGLAWTSVGGVVLPCEATTMNGTGKLALTGSLGKVMQESGQAAMSYIRHNAKALKIEEDFIKSLIFTFTCQKGQPLKMVLQQVLQ